MKSRWLLAALPLFVLAVLLGYFAVSLMAGGDKALPSTLIDRPVPPTDLPSLRAGDAAFTDAEVRALAAQGPRRSIQVIDSKGSDCEVRRGHRSAH